MTRMKTRAAALCVLATMTSAAALAQAATPEQLQQALQEARAAAERAQAAAAAAEAALARVQAQAQAAPATQAAPAAKPNAYSAYAPGISVLGNIDVGLKSTSHTDPTRKKTELAPSNSSTSLIFLRGRKDVREDLAASFQLEIDYNPAQSSTANGAPGGNAFQGTPFTGEQFVALAGPWGEVKLGSPNAGAFLAGLTSQPFGTALGGGWSGGFGRLGSAAITGVNQFDANGAGRIIRHEKALAYASPEIAGLRAMVDYSFGNDNSAAAFNNNNEFRGLTLKYGKGPLNAVYSFSEVRAGAAPAAGPAAAIGTAPAGALPAGTHVTWHVLGANYTLGAFTLYGGYTTTRHHAPVALEDSHSWNLAGRYFVTPKIELLANYLVRDSVLANVPDARLLGLGGNYYIDPATNLYLRYEGLRFGAAGAVLAQRQNVWATGVRFQF